MAQQYQIRVRGAIGDRWAGWFDGMQIDVEDATDGSQITTLSGSLADQAALRGILTKLWNLNLTLIAVSRVETGTE